MGIQPNRDVEKLFGEAPLGLDEYYYVAEPSADGSPSTVAKASLALAIADALAGTPESSSHRLDMLRQPFGQLVGAIGVKADDAAARHPTAAAGTADVIHHPRPPRDRGSRLAVFQPEREGLAGIRRCRRVHREPLQRNIAHRARLPVAFQAKILMPGLIDHDPLALAPFVVVTHRNLRLL